MNPGKVTSPELQAYQEAARKYRSELLHLTYFKLKDALKFFTIRLGIRYEETVGAATLGAQFAPYKHDLKTNKDLNIVFRTLHTYFGAAVLDFEPNSVISTLMGKDAAKMGDAQKNANVAVEVLKQMAADLSESLYDAIWTAQRNDNGTTTAELFDGFQTIIDKEIAAGTIAASKGNYLELTEEITDINAYDVIKKAVRKANPKLKGDTGLLAYMSEEVRDLYDDAYLATHAGIVYNKGFENQRIEGSRAVMVAEPFMAGSKYIVLSTKKNMLVGMDQTGDDEKIEVDRFSPFVLTFSATCFFGTQFESIDPRRLFVIKLAGGEESGSASGSASGSGE